MSVTYRTFEGKSVSAQWYALLAAARRDRVAFSLTSGHRTMAEQQYLYDGFINGRPGFNRAARPSADAPHIRVGRPDHAVDVDGSQALIDWAARHGITLERTVGGEGWHLEARGGYLGNFPSVRVLRGGMRGKDVAHLVRDLQWLGYLPYPFVGRPTSYFGGWVNTAVRHLQQDYHLKVDAVAGEGTLHAIANAIKNRKRSGYRPKRTRPLLVSSAPRRPPKPQRPVVRVSVRGIGLIMEFEGWRPKAYVDAVGVWTIGWGNTGPAAHPGNVITRMQGTALLRQDLAEAEDAIKRLVKVPLNQHQLDALASWTFNCGVGALAASTLLKILNRGDYRRAAQEFGRWVHGNGSQVLPGLVRRRQAETKLFLEGVK